MAKISRWLIGLFIAGFIVAAPYVYYRYEYTHYRRFRVVDPGILYRSGSLTAPGFREIIKEYGIRTIINVRDDFPEPDLDESFLGHDTITERRLCQEMGVRYVFLPPDLVGAHHGPAERPKAIDKFLELMDDPTNHPVLLHCKAGLHRTGCLAAVYRMEYDRWPMEQALRELKGHGFGEYVSTEANVYIAQYVVQFKPGLRKAVSAQQSGLSSPLPIRKVSFSAGGLGQPEAR